MSVLTAEQVGEIRAAIEAGKVVLWDRPLTPCLLDTIDDLAQRLAASEVALRQSINAAEETARNLYKAEGQLAELREREKAQIAAAYQTCLQFIAKFRKEWELCAEKESLAMDTRERFGTRAAGLEQVEIAMRNILTPADSHKALAEHDATLRKSITEDLSEPSDDFAKLEADNAALRELLLWLRNQRKEEKAAMG